MPKLNLSALCCGVALAMSCGSAGPEYQDGRGNTLSADARGCQTTSGSLLLLAAADYNTVIKPQILSAHCTGACHAPGKPQANIDLSTYDGAKNFFDASLADMQSGAMPVGGGARVPDDKIATFQQWKAGGFLMDPPPAPTPTPTAPAGGGGGGGQTGSTGGGQAGGSGNSSTASTADNTSNSSSDANQAERCLY